MNQSYRNQPNSILNGLEILLGGFCLNNWVSLQAGIYEFINLLAFEPRQLRVWIKTGFPAALLVFIYNFDF